MLLQEVFDRPASIEWTTDTADKKVASTNIGDRQFIATFVPFGHYHSDMKRQVKTWLVSFVPKDTKEDWMTGHGDALLFASTFYHIVNDSIENKGVEGIYVEARPEPSRVLLFSRLLKRLANQHNWKKYDEGVDFKHFWWYAVQ